MAGTNFWTKLNSTVDVALTDGNGNAMLVRSTVANIPSAAAGYAIGCDLIASDTGNHYYNKGSATSCDFKLVTVAA